MTKSENYLTENHMCNHNKNQALSSISDIDNLNCHNEKINSATNLIKQNHIAQNSNESEIIQYSLLNELESKWNFIEKNKLIRNRINSFNSNNISCGSYNSITNNSNLNFLNLNSSKIKNVNYLKNAIMKSKKKYLYDKQKNVAQNSEFEEYIKEKSNQLNKHSENNKKILFNFFNKSESNRKKYISFEKERNKKNNSYFYNNYITGYNTNINNDAITITASTNKHTSIISNKKSFLIDHDTNQDNNIKIIPKEAYYKKEQQRTKNNYYYYNTNQPKNQKNNIIKMSENSVQNEHSQYISSTSLNKEYLTNISKLEKTENDYRDQLLLYNKIRNVYGEITENPKIIKEEEKKHTGLFYLCTPSSMNDLNKNFDKVLYNVVPGTKNKYIVMNHSLHKVERNENCNKHIKNQLKENNNLVMSIMEKSKEEKENNYRKKFAKDKVVINRNEYVSPIRTFGLCKTAKFNNKKRIIAEANKNVILSSPKLRKIINYK